MALIESMPRVNVKLFDIHLHASIVTTNPNIRPEAQFSAANLSD